MTRRRLQRAFLPGVSLGLLILMAGCGGGGGGSSNTTPPPSNNPVPAISSLAPTSATAGAAAQTLTINGSNFITTSTVTYNGTAHTATYVSASQLTIQLTTGDQATAGTFAVVVTNPSPGGGASNSVSFTVNNPTPAISSLAPNSATAGAAAQTLTINGSNFVSTSTVTYNGTAHTPTVVSASQITIQLTTGDQATAGTFAVVVTNPSPGGGASNSVNFTVNASNPVPSISSLAPPSATAGHAAQTLQINGTGFLSTSTVTYNGVGHTASFVSATELTIQLSAADQLTAGDYPVVVTNPTPGGGHSNTVDFDVTGPTINISITSPSDPASVNVGATLPITVSVTGATANVVWTVDGVTNGNSTYGTISGTYPAYTYTPPSVIPGNDNPVTLEAAQSGTSESTTLMVTIKGSTTTKTAVSVAGGTTASGINFSLTADSSITLGFVGVGTCNYPTNGECAASVSGIQISASGAATSTCPNSTCTVWLLGQGLSNSGGTTVTTGLTIQVSDGSGSSINVGTISAGPVTGGFTGVNFPVTVSSGTAVGVRDLIVTLPDGETQVYAGAIQIVN